MVDIDFNKYQVKGAYHWDNCSYNPFIRNSFVLGRYEVMKALLYKTLGGQSKGKRVLDVGCGDGVLLNLIYKKGLEAHGVDGSEIAIQYAREKSNTSISYEIGNVYELPYDDDFFDAVISSEVIEHLKDYKKYLSEIQRVTKNGGTIIISTPIRNTENVQDPQHITEFYPQEYQSMISSILGESSFYESHPLFWMELYLRRYIFQVIINVISLFFNPFSTIKSKFRYNSIQYSVTPVNK